MASYNRVVLLGNLTADPELRYTAGKKAVVDVGVAINERYKRDGEYVEEVSFLDVTFFGRTAEVASEFLSKGAPALIEGRLKQERWEKDGQRRSRVKVIADRLTLIGPRQADDNEEAVAAGAAEF
ncbi:single-stranded DNA-binding protein [Botrimarina mediterranea]|uniref:Single-stranded DNA-binding protein n=1 Tax=Botrimarina mediterranea TaxID=2528022 RepID=A0A518K9Q1_9BACT|nr:single-stranded DNA-binding protein [Botrimarina mediterranea]QDV74525.1 Single-stranded DNA-binding protein [Botrimarina mediterranea]